jgi:hypothetical protein
VNTASGTLTMDGCTLTGNSAGQAGGGAGISGTDTRRRSIPAYATWAVGDVGMSEGIGEPSR